MLKVLKILDLLRRPSGANILLNFRGGFVKTFRTDEELITLF
jgi:hypothetical protein